MLIWINMTQIYQKKLALILQDYNTNFQDEIGIPELEKLYYDLFNFKLGEFKNMSKNAKQDYNNDLLNFIIHLLVQN